MIHLNCIYMRETVKMHAQICTIMFVVWRSVSTNCAPGLVTSTLCYTYCTAYLSLHQGWSRMLEMSEKDVYSMCDTSFTPFHEALRSEIANSTHSSNIVYTLLQLRENLKNWCSTDVVFGGAGWPSHASCLWIKMFEVRAPAATPCLDIMVVVQTATYKLMKFNFTVYSPVIWMRRKTEAPSQLPNWCLLVILNNFLFDVVECDTLWSQYEFIN